MTGTHKNFLEEKNSYGEPLTPPLITSIGNFKFCASFKILHYQQNLRGLILLNKPLCYRLAVAGGDCSSNRKTNAWIKLYLCINQAGRENTMPNPFSAIITGGYYPSTAICGQLTSFAPTGIAQNVLPKNAWSLSNYRDAWQQCLLYFSIGFYNLLLNYNFCR